MEWSYEYVQKQHKELRERREQIARKCVESWLEVLLYPHLTTAEALPVTFNGYVSGGVPTKDELPEGVDELVKMAAKLGWKLLVWTAPRSDPTRRVEFNALFTHTVCSDSDWDLIAVRAKKHEAQLKAAAEIVRTAVWPLVGHSNGIPPLIPVDGKSAAELDRHRCALADLGWKLERADVNHLFFLAKLE